MSEEYYHNISQDALDDLACRFLLNLPETDKNDPIRICFAIEQAYWFYVKYGEQIELEVEVEQVREHGGRRRGREKERGSVKEFAAHLFRHVPFLRVHSKNVEEIVESWLEYKMSIPTYGAIILNPTCTKVLLVESVNGYWGFPKGKINEGEQVEDCAVREVCEETGININCELNSAQYLEEVICGQTLRLFIVLDTRENRRLKPRCRREIRNIKWFNIALLPRSLKDKSCIENTGYTSGSFYWTIPFLTKLEQFIEQRESKYFKNEEEELMRTMGLPTEFAGGMKSF